MFKYNKPNSSTAINSEQTTIKVNTTTATATIATNVAITDHAASACTMSGSVTNAAEFASNSTGGSGAHNNMQPFTTVNYIISTGD
jgi:microcystin-dependent protein